MSGKHRRNKIPISSLVSVPEICGIYLKTWKDMQKSTV
jgi:hypothetical protein